MRHTPSPVTPTARWQNPPKCDDESLTSVLNCSQSWYVPFLFQVLLQRLLEDRDGDLSPCWGQEQCAEVVLEQERSESISHICGRTFVEDIWPGYSGEVRGNLWQYSPHSEVDHTEASPVFPRQQGLRQGEEGGIEQPTAHPHPQVDETFGVEFSSAEEKLHYSDYKNLSNLEGHR